MDTAGRKSPSHPQRRACTGTAGFTQGARSAPESAGSGETVG